MTIIPQTNPAPASANVLVEQGDALLQSGSLDPAIEALCAAIDLDPKNAKALYQRGYVYDIKGERDPAMADYNQAMRLLRR